MHCFNNAQLHEEWAGKINEEQDESKKKSVGAKSNICFCVSDISCVLGRSNVYDPISVLGGQGGHYPGILS